MKVTVFPLSASTSHVSCCEAGVLYPSFAGALIVNVVPNGFLTVSLPKAFPVLD